MLHEFAVEPGAVANWQNFRYIVDQCGVPTGRMISRFPKKWERMVYEASEACGDIDRTRIVEGLSRAKSKLLPSGRTYDSNVPWLQNAELQHEANPFRAIVSHANPNNNAQVLMVDDLSGNDLWNVPREDVVSRRANTLGASLELLLRHSAQVLFVDQHFKPQDERFRETLRLFARLASQGRQLDRLEYHVNEFEPDFEQNCRRHLPQHLPRGVELVLIRWRRQLDGDDLHPRYVLTEMGGIRIEHGLDQGPHGTSTDISLLSTELYEQRWREYQRVHSPFYLVEEIRIVGTG